MVLDGSPDGHFRVRFSPACDLRSRAEAARTSAGSECCQLPATLSPVGARSLCDAVRAALLGFCAEAHLQGGLNALLVCGG